MSVSRRTDGCSVTGGRVYRGTAIPGLEGRLVLGDFSTTIMKPSGQLFVATPTPRWRAPWDLAPLAGVDARLHSLGEDAQGELYLLTTAQGIPVGQTEAIATLLRDRTGGRVDLDPPTTGG